MATLVLPVDALRPDPEVIARAAAILTTGGLVAFPTETVYGLGANALDADAVGRIFAAKGRPATNPVIVHTPDTTSSRTLTVRWPETATHLAERFWPGPLTLVLPKAERVPAVVTAGGPTVALRVPAHPVALALLDACGFPLAAPSANRSSRLSPTQSRHVLAALGGRIDLVLDAGPTSGGLESSVLDLTGPRPRLLRPGLVSLAELEAIVGPVLRPAAENDSATLKSPGLLERHYAPRTPLECVPTGAAEHVRRLRGAGIRVGWLTYPPAESLPNVITTVLPAESHAYAALLYAALHDLDAAGLDRIIVTLPPMTDDWLAIRDRLKRAETK
jgi:L-threonylcarbamoyladenylate synthase